MADGKSPSPVRQGPIFKMGCGEARQIIDVISGETVEKGHFETGLLLRVVFSDFKFIHLLIDKSMVLIARHQ